MPELPEVETTARGIIPVVRNQIVEAVTIRQHRLRWDVPSSLKSLIQNRQVFEVARRAKYLLLIFEHGALLIHLGMSGRLKILDCGVKPERHDHVDLVFSSGKMLRFNDPRRFGSIRWLDGNPLDSAELSHLGPEPFDEKFTGKMLFEVSRGRSITIKSFIMDGRVVAGIGNIYANEALFRSGIFPGRQAGRIALRRYRLLVPNIQAVLTEAIEAGGTTLRDYMAATGQPGYFEQSLQVYNREGQSCIRCDGIIRKQIISQRATYYCGDCQRY
ncbi:MAG: DNA-formamidopyrimidine glycosylase [Acidiferrobacteraceae bacterium]|nr:DNA-formamidopyrimidine glycosylase [Acidiferrobacteraceae bacterium]|tara:strand:+ start:1946 stop:2764 length:819 start_codon:yes stop_codon:yes gene_type:complete